MLRNERISVNGFHLPRLALMGAGCLFLIAAVCLFPADRGLARERPMDTIFNAADTNGDGLISEQEWHQAMQKRFETLDANKDGNVSREEFEKQKETLREKFRNRRQ